MGLMIQWLDVQIIPSLVQVLMVNGLLWSYAVCRVDWPTVALMWCAGWTKWCLVGGEEARTCDFSLLVLTIVKWRVIVDGFGVLGDYFNIKQNQVIPKLDGSVQWRTRRWPHVIPRLDRSV
ncbi:hypothetical protein V6Z11_D07G203700 [Gossypium hirsutum]